MTLGQGLIAYLTNGSPTSLAPLPVVTEFAESVDHHTSVIIRLPRRTEPAVAKKYVEDVRSQLPNGWNPFSIKAVLPKELRLELAELKSNGGSMLALLPRRRRGVSRVLNTNFYERLLHDGLLPVLVLPPSGTMAPIRRILFPADFSPRSIPALDRAIALAKRFAAELHLLHVYGPDRLLPSELDTERRSSAKTPYDLLKIDKEKLETLRERAESQGVRTVAETAEGRAHEQILRYVPGAEIDLIAMSSHGPRNYEDIFRGTTTVRVIQHASVPVLASHD